MKKNTFGNAAALLLALLAPLANRASAAAPPPIETTPQLQYAWEERVDLAPSQPIGRTGSGYAFTVPITGGTVSGPDIEGTIVPGGADYQSMDRDGVFHVNAIYMLKTSEGSYIKVVNPGVARADAHGLIYFYTQPKFTAGPGKYAYLNDNIFVGRGLFDGTKLVIRFYQIVQ
jgi:hypothetical protein